MGEDDLFAIPGPTRGPRLPPLQGQASPVIRHLPGADEPDEIALGPTPETPPTVQAPLHMPALERPACDEREPFRPEHRAGLLGLAGVVVGVGLLSPVLAFSVILLCSAGHGNGVAVALILAYYAAVAIYFAAVYWVSRNSTVSIWILCLQLAFPFEFFGAIGLIGGAWPMAAQGLAMVILPPSFGAAYTYYLAFRNVRLMRRHEAELQRQENRKTPAQREQELRDRRLPPPDRPHGPML